MIRMRKIVKILTAGTERRGLIHTTLCKNFSDPCFLEVMCYMPAILARTQLIKLGNVPIPGINMLLKKRKDSTDIFIWAQ